MTKSNIYFISDAHFGLPDEKKSRERELLFIKWLNEVEKDAAEIYLMGDIFDFWYEWKRCAPQGFVRLLGKLAQMVDNGTVIHFFTGNHDIWAFSYLERELGLIIHRKPVIKTINNKTFYLAHGDGLGPGDVGFKLLKKIFTSKIIQWFFSKLHPDISLWFGNAWSHHRRAIDTRKYEFKGEDKEWLIIHSKEILKTQPIDFFIYGHRHIPIYFNLSENSSYINIGDWLFNFTYAVFDGTNVELKKYQ